LRRQQIESVGRGKATQSMSNGLPPSTSFLVEDIPMARQELSFVSSSIQHARGVGARNLHVSNIVRRLHRAWE
jgi:hypothetical protein